MFKATPILAVALGVLSVPLLGAAPASGATLPPGDTLYALSCEGVPAATPATFAVLYALDGDTAAATPVDSPSTGIDDDCAGPAAYDPTTGHSYYLSRTAPSTLALIDVSTGLATPVDGFVGGSANPNSIAIGNDGAAYAIWMNVLYSLDLETAALTTIGDPMPDVCLFGFSVDPTTGLFYAIQCDTGTVYRVDVATAALTEIGQFTGVDPNDDGQQDIFALQIDTAGRWWIEAYDFATGDQFSMLFSSPIPDGVTTPEFEGPIEAEGISLDVPSLLITYTDVPPPPAPPLPATGPADPMAVLIGALGIVAVGGIVLTLRALRRTT